MNAVKLLKAFSKPRRVVSLVFVLIISASSTPATHGGQKGDTPGVPWTGERGIVETVDQIMSREEKKHQLKGEDDSGKTRKSHRPLPTEPTLQDNPFAPVVPQWPLASGSSNRPAPLLPQLVGTSFQAATLAES